MIDTAQLREALEYVRPSLFPDASEALMMQLDRVHEAAKERLAQLDSEQWADHLGTLAGAIEDWEVDWFKIGGEQLGVVLAGARKYLELKKAGALIITPESEGHWPFGLVGQVAAQAGIPRYSVVAVLDALRDAIPPEEEK